MTKQSLKFPKIYLGGGTVEKIQGRRHHTPPGRPSYELPDPKYLIDDNIDFNAENFKVYVNDQDFFMSKLPVLNAGNTDNVALWWNNNAPYYRLITAVYLSTYCCGIGAEHFKFSEDVYPVITSIMRFHLYFTTRRILRRLFTESKSSIIREFNVPKNSHVIDNMENIPRYWKTLGLRDQWRLKSNFRSDYKKFIPKKTNGLTKIGIQYLNETIEAYVYAVLGSQAKTRVSIVNKGGGSLETQEEFRTLVNDAIVNYSVSTWILNMNKSVTDTNVIQNLAISPNTWLVPGSMIILKKRIVGYNNLLKRASGDMKFGINHSVNFTEIKKRKVVGDTTAMARATAKKTAKTMANMARRGYERSRQNSEKKPVLDSLDEHVSEPEKKSEDKRVVNNYDGKFEENNLVILSAISAALGFFLSKYLL